MGCCLRRLQLTTKELQDPGDDEGDPQPTSLRRCRARQRGGATFLPEEGDTTTTEETEKEEMAEVAEGRASHQGRGEGHRSEGQEHAYPQAETYVATYPAAIGLYEQIFDATAEDSVESYKFR